jgi:hypothetical protein
MINDKLKRLIFNKLYEDLSNVEIIPYKSEIWFIDREKKYWYFEYEKSGVLWWNYQFCMSFFSLFSMEQSAFQKVISEWVEEVLNCKVKRTYMHDNNQTHLVGEVLNIEVNSTLGVTMEPIIVDRILEIVRPKFSHRPEQVEQILNHKVKDCGYCASRRWDEVVVILLNQ